MSNKIATLNDKNIIAVYGTLKRGTGNHRVMENAGGKFIGEDYIEFSALEGYGFPVAKFEVGTGKMLKVELFEVSKEGVEQNLDRLEGHPHHYYRKAVPTINGVQGVITYETVAHVTDDSDRFQLDSDVGEDRYYEWK